MTKKEPNFDLKQMYVELPINEATAFRSLVLAKCNWNTTIWFNKIHHKTPVAPLEQAAIKTIYTKILNIVNDDAN
jgi:hypothetical protein